MFLLACPANQLLILCNKWRLVFIKKGNNYPIECWQRQRWCDERTVGWGGSQWSGRSGGQKSVSSGGLHCVSRAVSPHLSLPPPPVLWISRWAWFGFGAVGLSIACGTCPTDTVIDSVSATWRTERPGVWRGWQRGHGGAEKEGFLLSGWVKRTDKPKLDHLEPHECTWQERAFTFGMGDRNKDRVY